MSYNVNLCLRMKGSVGPPKDGRIKFSSSAVAAQNEEMAPPILAKNRYGREDMLALFSQRIGLEEDIRDRMGGSFAGVCCCLLCWLSVCCGLLLMLVSTFLMVERYIHT